MRPVRASLLSAALGAGVVLSSACTYHNTIYNAGLLYDRAERSRRSGQDSLSRALYRDVIDKTEAAYRARPASDWAAEAMYLAGRSRLRIGELEAARAALTEAESLAGPDLARSIRVYQAAALAQSGDAGGALATVNEALGAGVGGPARAEAHLLRGRWLLANAYIDQGWWDLDRAAEIDPAIRVEAGLERLRWSIEHGDVERARSSMTLLLSYPEAGARLDEVAESLTRARGTWGPDVAAGLLEPARSARWEREARGRLRLTRARLLREGGDPAAEDEAWGVARTLGIAAAEARVLLARWHLQQTEDIADAYAVRRILLPAGVHPDVTDLVGAVDELEILTDIGLEDPLAWFAAAEIARDRLSADYLARGLFLAYADGAPEEPWVPKALLAAIAVSPAEGDRAWLRGRLEAHDQSPYVRAARGATGAGFEALEEELRVRLRELRSR